MKFEDSCEHIFTCAELSEEGSPRLNETENELINTNFNQFAFVSALNEIFPANYPKMTSTINFFTGVRNNSNNAGATCSHSNTHY